MVGQWHGRRHAWTTAGAAAALGAVLLSATGCTENGTAVASDKSSKSPGAVVREAANVLVRYGTSRTRTSMTMASGGTRIAVDGEGRFDYRKRIGQLTVRLPEGASGAQPGERRPVKEIVVPEALYMKNRGAGVPAEKWVRVDTTSLADGNLVSGGVTDPVSAAELLRGARHVTYEGAGTVRGERVRHYRGRVDLDAAARVAAPRWRDQLAAAAKGFSRATVPFDAYIDGQGRLRKIRHRFTFVDDGAPSEAGGAVAVSSTTWLYGFGVPVTIAMPEAGDIYAGKIAPF
ncbi:MAG: hypothetical protein ACRDP3_07200 [Streptomyces sp.]|uniref:hypothetical protein n=1 Tax=Streptomyces sp. TaxID=1931 RepID=UPI003D6B1B87